ncbi:ABC transporter ATP-binding protein [Sulfobacillus thermosulfidooxidans]|uniref:ABC transporter ATP-binding protein n=1 Tax=Sulfobacillus thermosulfidooxidans TaxID=28034 RepID=UPI00041AA09C|nr:ABC transporter ATP-binding protein [Sulfobacillus thermosulfidooxidans]
MALLQVSSLSCGYHSLNVLHDIHLDVEPGQQVVLLGANGAGKTTLLKCLIGLIPTSSGHIMFAGQDITEWSPSERVKGGLAYLSEVGVIASLSVEDNLNIGGYYLSRQERRQQLQRLFEQLPLLYEKRKDPAGSLSGGQRKILGFAKVLMGKPQLILMDEPSSGLAPVMVNEMMSMLKTYRSSGPAFLIAEQNIKFLEGTDDVYVLDNGQIRFHGTPNDLDADAHVKAAYFGLN